MGDEHRFGWGLAVVDGDIELDPGEHGVGLREVTGGSNLLQALKLRVLTPAGSDRFNTLYGMDYAQIFGSADGLRAAKDLIRLNVVRTLATDARVRDVREIAFHDDPLPGGDQPDLAEEARRLERLTRQFVIDVVVQTADEDEIALRLTLGGG